LAKVSYFDAKSLENLLSKPGSLFQLDSTPIPESYNQHLVGSYGTHPSSDDTQNFMVGTQHLLHYASAVATVLGEAETRDETVVLQLHLLVGDLVDEANRRLERAMDAVGIIEGRLTAAQPAAHRQQAGEFQPTQHAHHQAQATLPPAPVWLGARRGA